ncbi:MAG: hypothetical protein AAGA19_06085 [Pseudomonadota bacterium]
MALPDIPNAHISSRLTKTLQVTGVDGDRSQRFQQVWWYQAFVVLGDTPSMRVDPVAVRSRLALPYWGNSGFQWLPPKNPESVQSHRVLMFS